MKDIFFTFLALSLPLLAAVGVVYMFLHGVYHVISDWQLSKELKQLRQESRQRHSQRSVADAGPRLDPLAAFSDAPPTAESPGILTIPLEPVPKPIRSAPPSPSPTAADSADSSFADSTIMDRESEDAPHPRAGEEP